MIQLLLFYEFLKTGIFAIGGGYATIPFLYHICEKYNWFTVDELTDMIAISNITPGAVGINMATYTGIKTCGILGGMISITGLITGPFIITIFAIYFLNKYKNTKLLKNFFQGLIPASCALLTYTFIQLSIKNIFVENNLKALIITLILFFIYPFVRKNPSLIIFIGGFFGILFNVF